MYIEIDIKEARKTSETQAIKDGYFMIWHTDRIKNAFAFGNGTMKDFFRYRDDNKQYCIIKNIDPVKLANLYPAILFDKDFHE